MATKAAGRSADGTEHKSVTSAKRVTSMKSILFRSVKKAHVIGMFVLAFGLFAPSVLMPSVGNAQDARVAKLMAALKDKTTKLGAPKIDGTDLVEGRDAPALYFGSTKMNNNFSVVAEIAKEGGRGSAATLFVGSLIRRAAGQVSPLQLDSQQALW